MFISNIFECSLQPSDQPIVNCKTFQNFHTSATRKRGGKCKSKSAGKQNKPALSS